MALSEGEPTPRGGGWSEASPRCWGARPTPAPLGRGWIDEPLSRGGRTMSGSSWHRPGRSSKMEESTSSKKAAAVAGPGFEASPILRQLSASSIMEDTARSASMVPLPPKIRRLRVSTIPIPFADVKTGVPFWGLGAPLWQLPRHRNPKVLKRSTVKGLKGFAPFGALSSGLPVGDLRACRSCRC